VEDRGHAGSAGNLSPKPASALGNNNYSRYRYYPPPSEASLSSLHASYQQRRSRDRFAISTTPASVTTRRDRHHRRGATPTQRASSASVSSSTTPMDMTMRGEGARTPVDGIGTAATPGANDRAYVDDSRESSATTPYNIHHQPRSNNQSFRSSMSSSVPFMSPPLDPRAGGGGGSFAMSGGGGSRSSAVRSGIRSPYHYQRDSPEEPSTFSIDTTAIPTTGEEEWVTPPAMDTTNQTHGHGHADDVYSQRRGATGQRRRRRGWDEINI